MKPPAGAITVDWVVKPKGAAASLGYPFAPKEPFPIHGAPSLVVGKPTTKPALSAAIEPGSWEWTQPGSFQLSAALTQPEESAPQAVQTEFEFEGSEQDRALIEQLIAATRLYETSEAVAELLAFTAKLRAFAPFNAMLLHIQKPGLTHAASARDWWTRFRRVPKRGARPLLVLRAMGPVDFVFDVLDTTGDKLPAGAFAFPTFGAISEARLAEMLHCVARERIEVESFDGGDGSAGWIARVGLSPRPKGKHLYRLAYNRNHPPTTRFVTIAHELAHLFLGHLGADNGRGVSDRSDRDHALREIEAETAAYLVAKRNGVSPRSESYLSAFKGSFSQLDLYAVMRAANAAETAMGIGAHRLWAKAAQP